MKNKNLSDSKPTPKFKNLRKKELQYRHHIQHILTKRSKTLWQVPRFREIPEEPTPIENFKEITTYKITIKEITTLRKTPLKSQRTTSLYNLHTQSCDRGLLDSHTSRVFRIEYLILIRLSHRPKIKPPRQVRRQIIYYEYSFSTVYPTTIHLRGRTTPTTLL